MAASYLRLLESGELKERLERLKEKLKDCSVCPRRCRVDRTAGEKGACRTGSEVRVASAFLHRGEERPIRGIRGSGTIFFSNCNMNCVFCQNYDLSQLGEGVDLTPAELAQVMLALQNEGAHNINLVTPSHVVPQIVEAIYLAAQKGLSVPIVYNTSSYDDLETLRLLDGVVDIYLADFKFADEELGRRYSKVKNYPEVATEALREMLRQVGNLKTDQAGVATRGVLVRHLVMPNHLENSLKVIDTLAELMPGLAVNVMGQYRPYFKAFEYPEIARPVLPVEVAAVKNYARQKGLTLVED